MRRYLRGAYGKGTDRGRIEGGHETVPERGVWQRDRSCQAAS